MVGGASSAADQSSAHVPVLLTEVLDHLLTDPAGIYVDATFGRGGHTRALLEKLNSDGRVFGFDRDVEAVAEGQRLAHQDERFSINKGQFGQLGELLERYCQGGIVGVLMDVGVSSPQLDTPERGFSFMQDGPLDMRMDQTSGMSAGDWLAQATEKEISWVLKVHGEERFARRIAQAIVASGPIDSTLKLADIVANAVPSAVRHRPGKHPATQTFQALRVHINGEADELKSGLEQAFTALAPGGRLAVVSFHSLEDRVVKHQFRAWSKPAPIPRRVPVMAAQQSVAGRHIAGPIKAGAAELAANPRSRSAVLRVVEKMGASQ